MVDVFISYAREDHDAAAKLAKLVENSGYSVWWDPAIPPGKKWAEIIGTQLGAARCVVVLWSAASVAKRWVRKEASFADTRNKLIPARLEDVTIPFEFADVQAADLTGWQKDINHGGIRHLLSAISEQVRKPCSGNPEDDIAAATEQAKAQLAESQAIQGQLPTTDAKTEKVFFRNAGKRLNAHMPVPGLQMALPGKNAIIIASVFVLLAALGIAAWIWGEALTNKAYRNKNISTDELIALLEVRAEKIENDLRNQSFNIHSSQSMYLEEIIKKFNFLHKQHVDMLKKGYYVSAHEVLVEIHSLSVAIERIHGMHIHYRCGFPYYVRGRLINTYVAGFSAKATDAYPINEIEKEKNRRLTSSGCGPSLIMAEPAAWVDVYQIIALSN